jgi:hypothetical protein
VLGRTRLEDGRAYLPNHATRARSPRRRTMRRACIGSTSPACGRQTSARLLLYAPAYLQQSAHGACPRGTQYPTPAVMTAGHGRVDGRRTLVLCAAGACRWCVGIGLRCLDFESECRGSSCGSELGNVGNMGADGEREGAGLATPQKSVFAHVYGSGQETRTNRGQEEDERLQES